MNRKTLLKALALLAVAPAALAQSAGTASAEAGYPAPVLDTPVIPAAHLPFTHPRAGDRWREVAERSARDIVQGLGSYQKVTVAAASGNSRFERDFRELLVNALDDLGMFVVTANATPETRVVKFDVDVTAREQKQATAPKLVSRLYTMAVGGTPVEGEDRVFKSADVAVTVSVKTGDVFLVRRTHEFNVETDDIQLYKSTRTLRVVGEK